MNSNYYSHKYFGKNYFICPQCRTAETIDWKTFRRSHPHLGAFSVSKKSILLSSLSHENVEMSSSGQNYGQMSFLRQNYNGNYGQKRPYFNYDQKFYIIRAQSMLVKRCLLQVSGYQQCLRLLRYLLHRRLLI